MFQFKKTLIAGLLLSVMSSATVVVADDSAIKTQLKKMLPNESDVANALITATPLRDLYQVQIGMMVVYMSEDGRYLFNGNLIDLPSRSNLTAMAKNKARAEAVSQIDSASMIHYPAKGDQKHLITIFSDIDCPYCVKLHKEIPALNAAGVSVRYLAYPRAGFGSASYDKAVSVWCAKDPVKAMDKAMLGGSVERAVCVNPVREHMMHAERFGVNGTPNIILDNGELLPGYVPAQELLTHLN